MEEWIYGLARGFARGTIDGLGDVSDKIPAIAEGLARGVLRAWQAFTTPTRTDSPTPPETDELRKRVEAIQDAPTLP